MDIRILFYSLFRSPVQKSGIGPSFIFYFLIILQVRILADNLFSKYTPLPMFSISPSPSFPLEHMAFTGFTLALVCWRRYSSFSSCRKRKVSRWKNWLNCLNQKTTTYWTRWVSRELNWQTPSIRNPDHERGASSKRVLTLTLNFV